MAQKNAPAAIPTAGDDHDRTLSAKVSDGASEALNYLGRQTRSARARLAGAFATHP